MVTIIAACWRLNLSPTYRACLGSDHDNFRAFLHKTSVQKRGSHTKGSTSTDVERLDLIWEIKAVNFFNLPLEVPSVINELIGKTMNALVRKYAM